MGWHTLVTVLLGLHFAYLGYVVFGGFLAWRWPKLIWPHLLAGAWGVAVVGVPLTCPLTEAEYWARRRAGGRGATAGFIDRYIEGVLYPERYTFALQILVGVVVLGSWAGAYLLRRRRNRTANTATKTEVSS
ncbi:hypothetical protein Val02_27780 [Virgisporangium aliadipatigenens]|uniref:DUF2784 domain-containing protein n=1 Tax=Virgisporangium aliadipatigenens TaxID=741659 RepID=A0A8J3YKD1_9ACTN|nr:DUF2784 domain-containing protein [Virgisporangium aliadipatigenens]GIJ45892.1 hypothetical protein Val02_27780 [Virgisporangium aliadipatigenens]